MNIDKSKVEKLKEDLLAALHDNSKTDQEFNIRLVSSDIDPKVKELMILLYSNIIAQIQTMRIANNKNLMSVIDAYLDILVDIDKEVESKCETLNAVIKEETSKPHSTGKWYYDHKNILMGGLVFVFLIGCLTVIFAFDKEAASAAVKTFIDVFVNLSVPVGGSQ